MMIKASELRAQKGLGNATAQPHATASATNSRPKLLKALAERVLGRNSERNRSATEGAAARNFSATETRRKRVLQLLAEHPAARYAALTDTEAVPGFVLLTLTIRDVATVDLLVPAEKWDGVLFLDLLERHGGTIH